MILKFTIPGNHKSKTGNPIPYLRMTQKQVKLLKIPDSRIMNTKVLDIKRRVRRYQNWKDYVKTCCWYESTIISLGRRPTGNELAELIEGKKKVKFD